MTSLRRSVYRAGLLVGAAWLWLGAGALAGQQAVVMYGDDRVEAWSFDELTPERLSGAETVWAWGPEAAPRRSEDEGLADFLASFQKIQDRDRLEVRLEIPGLSSAPPERVERELAGFRLRAAPAEMWGEVPEALLPSFAFDKTGRVAIPRDSERPWRLRLVGGDRGSWWIEVAAGEKLVRLTPAKALNPSVVLKSCEGEALPGGLTVLIEERGRQRVVAQYRSDGTGPIRLPALPDRREVVFLAGSSGYASRALSLWPSALPAELCLAPGGEIRGRFVDAEKRPVAGVEMRAEAWLDPTSSAYAARQGVSGADGRFSLDSLPRTEVAFAARREGFARLRIIRRFEGALLDLGDLELVPAREVAVLVVDEREDPVAGASVKAGSGPPVTTDHRGRGLLRVPDRDALVLTAEAAEHLPAEKRFSPPFDEELRLELRRAFLVLGRFVDADGAAVAGGTLRVRTGRSYDEQALTPEGRFDLDLTPGVEIALTLRSPSTRELRLSIEPGEPGELRDLGDLVAPSGITVRGRLVRDGDGTAVAGARVWTPRPTDDGEVVAWVNGDLLSTTSDGEGLFALQGLPRRSALLRIDAPDLARRTQRVEPPAEGEVVDLGDIPLGAGSDLRILVEDAGGPAAPGAPRAAGDATPAVARVDLRGEWQEQDMLTATVVDGEARVRRVPPGTSTVSVLRGRELLCEENVEIEAGDEEVVVDCRREESRVSGRVWVGGEPAGRGQLTWLPPAPPVPALILNSTTPLGAGRQRVFGAGRPQIDVEVDGTGFFTTDALRAGSWRVVFLPAAGGATPPRTVELARAPQQELELRFAASGVQGIVVDEEDVPVAGARVEEVVSKSFVLSDTEGRFELAGLEPGGHRVLARLGERRSELVDVLIDPARTPEPLVLRLAEHREDQVEVTVVDLDLPAAGCLAFVEGDDGTQRLVMTRQDGRAVVQLVPPLPTRLRAAALKEGRWALGRWSDLDAARSEGILLVMGETGALELSGHESQGLPQLVSQGGWNFTSLLQRTGPPPTLRPGEPLLLPGLPPGTYQLTLGDFHTAVTVRPGDLTEVELP